MEITIQIESGSKLYFFHFYPLLSFHDIISFIVFVFIFGYLYFVRAVLEELHQNKCLYKSPED